MLNQVTQLVFSHDVLDLNMSLTITLINAILNLRPERVPNKERCDGRKAAVAIVGLINELTPEKKAEGKISRENFCTSKIV